MFDYIAPTVVRENEPRPDGVEENEPEKPDPDWASTRREETHAIIKPVNRWGCLGRALQPTPLATLQDREWIPSEVFRENYFAKVGQNPFFFSKGYSGSWLLSS